MQTLANKRVLLGVTGGIAAYKSAELVRRLQDQGAQVRVVMTPAAEKFITPLTMQALSGNPVRTELLGREDEAAMEHIELARWADLAAVAPASANFLARLAAGMADDLLTTLCLATAAPLLAAPAMNQQMWQNPATQENIERLRARGVALLGPASGDQACGETGPGRMLDPDQIVQALSAAGRTERLAGIDVLVTAGPTREFIDPVRFLSNRSSGRMGYAVARAAVNAGATVTLASGPVALTPPAGARVVPVESAEQLREAVLAAAPSCDIFISVAAVADYRSAAAVPRKLKKSTADLQLRLEKTPDILAEVAALKNPPFTVGFAAETENLAAGAKRKLADKKLDMIAANQVGEELGFDSEENALEVYWRGGGCELAAAPKELLARQLVDLVLERYREKAAAAERGAAAAAASAAG